MIDLPRLSRSEKTKQWIVAYKTNVFVRDRREDAEAIYDDICASLNIPVLDVRLFCRGESWYVTDGKQTVALDDSTPELCALRAQFMLDLEWRNE